MQILAIGTSWEESARRDAAQPFRTDAKCIRWLGVLDSFSFPAPLVLEWRGERNRVHFLQSANARLARQGLARLDESS